MAAYSRLAASARMLGSGREVPRMRPAYPQRLPPRCGQFRFGRRGQRCGSYPLPDWHVLPGTPRAAAMANLDSADAVAVRFHALDRSKAHAGCSCEMLLGPRLRLAKLLDALQDSVSLHSPWPLLLVRRIPERGSDWPRRHTTSPVHWPPVSRHEDASDHATGLRSFDIDNLVMFNPSAVLTIIASTFGRTTATSRSAPANRAMASKDSHRVTTRTRLRGRASVPLSTQSTNPISRGVHGRLGPEVFS